METKTNFDKVFEAIERISGRHIVYLHDEANRYAFKYFGSEKWEIVDRKFIHEIAGIK